MGRESQMKNVLSIRYISLVLGSMILTTISFASNKSNEIVEERNIPLATSTFAPKKSHTVKARHLLRVYALRLTPFFTMSFDHASGTGGIRVTTSNNTVMGDNPYEFSLATIVVTADGAQVYSYRHEWIDTTVWGGPAKQTTIADPVIIRKIADAKEVWLTVQFLGESGPFDHMSFQLSNEQQEDMRLFISFVQSHPEWANSLQADNAPGPQNPVASQGAHNTVNSDIPLAHTGVFHMGVGGADTPPSVLYKIEPTYTEEARKAKFQGNVTVYVEVDASGRPQNVKVIHSPGLGLDEKAIEAVKQWTFRPGYKATRGGSGHHPSQLPIARQASEIRVVTLPGRSTGPGATALSVTSSAVASHKTAQLEQFSNRFIDTNGLISSDCST
jgi:TonB family protein